MDIWVDRLRGARLLSGLSQEEVADKAGISRTTLARYELGLHVPSVVVMGTLAVVLGVSVDWLLGLGEVTE